MRSARVAPDLSSASARVSEIVNTAIRSGTNCLLSSMPAMPLRARAVIPQNDHGVRRKIRPGTDGRGGRLVWARAPGDRYANNE